MRWPKKKTPASRRGIEKLLRRRFASADAERLAPWVLPAIGFHKLASEPAALGTTRFEGRPDLPDIFQWPAGPDGPLAFLGQVALKEVHALDLDGVLPESGLLTFFFNTKNYAWGSNAGDREKFAVRYLPGKLALRRRDCPIDLSAGHRSALTRWVEPYLRWELPEADALARRNLRFGDRPTVSEPAKDPFTDAFWTLAWDLCQSHIPVGKHHLLGWANGIYEEQDADCRGLCEHFRAASRGSKGVASGTAKGDVGRSRCLLQVYSDRKLYNEDWADGGTIAFMSHEEDLQNGEFGRCWCVLSSS